MADRTLSAVLEITDNITSVVENATKMLDDLENRVITPTINSSGMQVGMKAADTATQNVNKSMKGVKNSTKDVENVTSGLGSKLSGTFSSVKGSIEDTTGSVRNLAGALTAMAAGGAIAGFAWQKTAKNELYKEQVYDAIELNKKLGVSREMLKAQASAMAATGAYSSTQATEDLYSALQKSGKSLGTGQNALDNATKISNLIFSRQELMEKGGITDISSLMQMSKRAIGGKQDSRMVTSFLEATGLKYEDIKSEKSFMKAITSLGGEVNIGKELDDRPWINVEKAVSRLQTSIGKGLAPTMAFVANIVADLTDMLANIPGGTQFIGITALVIAFAGVLSMTLTVFAPLITLTRTYITLQYAQAAVTRSLTAAQIAWNIAMTANPIGLVIVGLATLIGILYIVEKKTGVISAIWKQMSSINFGKAFEDLINLDFKSLFKDLKIGEIFGEITSRIDFSKIIPLMFGPIGIIADFLYKSNNISEVTNKILEQLLSWWKKLVKMAEWVYDGIKGIVKWLTDIKKIIEDGLANLPTTIANAIKGIVPGMGGSGSSDGSGGSGDDSGDNGYPGGSDNWMNDEDYATAAGASGSMATGHPFVPKDMIVKIHKGERIIPASQNRAGSQGNIFNVNLGGIRIDKMSSEMDLNKLLSLIDKQAQKSIKNAIAQRRG